jgi:chorismate mutase
MTKYQDWGFGWHDLPRPLLIAGPCSAETEAQTIASCQEAASAGAHLLRAGIWKPRTRANLFEGVGAVGLEWLKTAAEQTGLPTTVEIANAHHVEDALKAGVNVLWIGARTTVNPFSVQEIADALRGVDIPVLIKNPINPDVNLWIGAFERLEAAGIHRMAAIHRGFSVPNSAPYRNKPRWDLAIELRLQLPGLQIINDPSHICGKRELLLGVAQKAMDLDFDGLMIETHCTPETAWTDAAQQVTGDGLQALLAQIIIRNDSSDNPFLNDKLAELREDIDALDAEIIELLGKRMDVSRQIGNYKNEHHITIFQYERWREILKTRSDWAKKTDLSSTFMHSFLNAIHQESIKQQTEVMNKIS